MMASGMSVSVCDECGQGNAEYHPRSYRNLQGGNEAGIYCAQFPCSDGVHKGNIVPIHGQRGPGRILWIHTRLFVVN